MGIKLQTRIETWKKLLLDFGKRNRLINFVEGKRNCIKIISPSPLELYEKIVTNESELSFPFAKKVRFTEDGEEIYEKICDGDILPSKPINETQKTLKNIRSKTRTALEEQGINTLYLTFGMLRWNDNDSSSTYLSPIVLVPVRIIIDSLSSPYRIAIQDDEIVVNPTLCYKLEHDFGIHLPDFDASSDSLESFLQTASKFIDSKGWSIENISYLANLSFLKINMYKDLERNNAKLNSNPIIAALAGETQFFSPSLPDNYNESDAIIEQTSLKSFQVVDADSSQQDAIRLSKRGASFVLQGPPGTGKSQTITNIIAEALADGKKVLFVSEKMAALQVVYNRLAHVGLSDFCFNLHSHKAKKKDILRNLESSINIIRKHVSKEALSHLETLDKKKKYLDSYQAQLHTKTSELDVSIYQVNGKLAELENIPDIYFDIPYIEEITPQIFKGQIDLLCRLSEHIKKCTVTLSENPWRDSNVKRLTISLKREVASNTSKLLSDIDSLDALMNEFYSKSGEGSVNSINTIKEICNHVKVYAQSPLFPLIWMEGDNLSKVSRIVQSVRGKTQHIINLKEKILNRFDKSVFNLDIITIRDSFLDIMARLSEKECGEKYNMLPMAISGIADDTECHIAKLDAIFECANRLTSDLGLGINTSPNDIILLYNTLKIISPLLLFKVPEIWFDENSLSIIKQEFNSHRDLHETTSEQKNTVLSNYDRNVLNIDYNTFLQKFIADYSSCLRFLKSSYRADIRALSNFAISGRKISYKEAIALLNAIKSIIENEQTINDNIDVFNNYYGCNYNGLATNWNALNDGITTFRDSFSEITLLPDCIKERIICGTLPKSEILQFIRLFESSDVERSLDYLFSAFNKDFNIFSKYSDIRIFGLSTCESARKFKESYDSISQASIEEPDFENLLDGVKIIYNHHNATEIFANNRDYHELWLGHFFNGLETNWDSIIAARKYASFLKNTIKEGGVKATTIQKVCEDFSFISFCKDISEKLEELSIKVENDIIWFSSLFEKTTDFSSENILNVAERASLCKKNIQLIQEWIDYRSLKEESEKLEIFDYLQALESIHIDPDTIVDIYKKRLYSLWLDMHLPQFPAVMRFNLDTHTRTINEFCSLDNAQFRIAQARVRERVVKRIPDFNKIHSTKDEIAILKREINKQRKVMPLRKLFQSIPRLLTSLRPCFMMSPLSVSVFLEAASYDFDMVIFDEASQVHTEDAIGSIMRGKQVIIVGDTRQLPPTSFFTASL
ncbi:MAG: DUF4011 domain-containing protein, partial [Muribaculaceae bacterium]|nr:DUF4011 domain-containing protein [Muribaculaceae bacterium]